jgi:hypothetical protein
MRARVVVSGMLMVSFLFNDEMGSEAPVFAAPGLCAFYRGKRGGCNGNWGEEHGF